MGRKTFQSINCLLPGRDTIIITRDTSFAFEGANVVHSLADAIETGDVIALKSSAKELMIIGGAEIYAQALPLCNRLYVTEVDLEPEGDAFFAPVNRTEFSEENRTAHPADADNEAAFSFVDYVRSS